MTLNPLPPPPSRRDELDEIRDQRDRAEVLFRVTEERNEKALRLHVQQDGYKSHCRECGLDFPCLTRRALTGADEADE